MARTIPILHKLKIDNTVALREVRDAIKRQNGDTDIVVCGLANFVIFMVKDMQFMLEAAEADKAEIKGITLHDETEAENCTNYLIEHDPNLVEEFRKILDVPYVQRSKYQQDWDGRLRECLRILQAHSENLLRSRAS